MFTLSQNGYGTHSAASMSRTELMTSIRQKKSPSNRRVTAACDSKVESCFRNIFRIRCYYPDGGRSNTERFHSPWLSIHPVGRSPCYKHDGIPTRAFPTGEKNQATGESTGDFEIRRESDQSIEMRTSESLTRWVVRTNHIQHKHPSSITNREEQIIETRDKPQCLAVQRLLSHLQYPDYTKSSTKDLSLPPSNLKSSWQ